ncbi:MAG: anaerobic ribonucleoside-triphosphate reductase activating protein, partial [Bacteroidota bacterium]|nr:anaerobic ribonucleoside-triphosphate reductase activating protein [Bacteroidota bacterium]
MKIGGFLKHTLTDYPGKIASIVFTKGCNFRCPYCHNPQLIENSDDELSPEIVLQYICKNKDLLDGVVITGGEPTLHRGLKTFILKVREIGLSVKLDTNGTHPEVLKDLMRDHLIDYIAMDI